MFYYVHATASGTEHHHDPLVAVERKTAAAAATRARWRLLMALECAIAGPCLGLVLVVMGGINIKQIVNDPKQ